MFAGPRPRSPTTSTSCARLGARDETIATAMLGLKRLGRLKSLSRLADGMKRFPQLAKWGPTAAPVLLEITRQMVQAVGPKLKLMNQEAREREDNMAAVLTGFREDLESGEQQRILLRGDG